MCDQHFLAIFLCAITLFFSEIRFCECLAADRMFGFRFCGFMGLGLGVLVTRLLVLVVGLGCMVSWVFGLGSWFHKHLEL